MIYTIMWSIVAIAFIVFAIMLMKSFKTDTKEETNFVVPKITNQDKYDIMILKQKIMCNDENFRFGDIDEVEYNCHLKEYYEELKKLYRKLGVEYD